VNTTDHDASQALSPSTLRNYGAVWALFTDWCAATGADSLPADPGTVVAFLAGCPAAVKTQRGRVRAIDHQHTKTGHAPPGNTGLVLATLGRPVPGPYRPAPETVAAVETALRSLPSQGWTKGVFGRRDRCLLVLSQLAGIPYTHLAVLIGEDVSVTKSGIVIITAAGRSWAVEPVDDPVLCGPCAIARWIDVLNTAVTKISTATTAHLVGNAEPVTAESPHLCRVTPAMDKAALSVPLLPPINQWGALPFPHPGLTPHAHSRRTRDFLAGDFVIHRDLPYPTDDPPAQSSTPASTVVSGPVYDRSANEKAWAKRRDDLRRIADVSDVLTGIDQQIAELQHRVDMLLAKSCDV
jgi:hypothetical protein